MMASVETMIEKPLGEQGQRLSAAVTTLPKSYLGEPKEWGRGLPAATTVSPRVRIGSLPHGQEPVK